METRITATSAQQVPVVAEQSTIDIALDASDRTEEACEATILQLDAAAGELLLRRVGL